MSSPSTKLCGQSPPRPGCWPVECSFLPSSLCSGLGSPWGSSAGGSEQGGPACQPGLLTWSSVPATSTPPPPLICRNFLPASTVRASSQRGRQSPGRGYRCKVSLCKEQRFHPSVPVKALTSGHGSHVCQPPIFQDEEEGTFAGEIREASLSSRIRPSPVRPGQDSIRRGAVGPQAGRQPPRDLVARESRSWGQADARSGGEGKAADPEGLEGERGGLRDGPQHQRGSGTGPRGLGQAGPGRDLYLIVPCTGLRPVYQLMESSQKL